MSIDSLWRDKYFMQNVVDSDVFGLKTGASVEISFEAPVPHPHPITDRYLVTLVGRYQKLHLIEEFHKNFVVGNKRLFPNHEVPLDSLLRRPGTDNNADLAMLLSEKMAEWGRAVFTTNAPYRIILTLDDLKLTQRIPAVRMRAWQTLFETYKGEGQ